MAAARRDFLSKGYYAPLLNALCREIGQRTGDAPVLLDTGCGEGYYTRAIMDAFKKAGEYASVLAGLSYDTIKNTGKLLEGGNA